MMIVMVMLLVINSNDNDKDDNCDDDNNDNDEHNNNDNKDKIMAMAISFTTCPTCQARGRPPSSSVPCLWPEQLIGFRGGGGRDLTAAHEQDRKRMGPDVVPGARGKERKCVQIR